MEVEAVSIRETVRGRGGCGVRAVVVAAIIPLAFVKQQWDCSIASLPIQRLNVTIYLLLNSLICSVS